MGRPSSLSATQRATDGFKMQDVTSGPARQDLCLTRELHVAGERRAEIVDVNVRLAAVIPPGDLLANPTGNRQRYLAVALARRRGFEFRDAFLEIRAAIAAQVRSRGARGGHETTSEDACSDQSA